MEYQIIDAPDTVPQLVIYEIPIKSFTSPGGPESGNFVSTAGRMEYLKQLGVNAIWLSGHQLCHEKHFYNIWTQYACIRPDVLDPSLGTEEEFKAMIECAHKNGLKVFLDVITHGVMEDSPLTREHPEWFQGGSWGMKDFDWYGSHPDLDAWWIETWCRYIEEDGIDGLRLDVAHYRNDLWAQIRKRARDAGKDIIILAENGPAIRGVVDIIQQGETIGETFGEKNSGRFLKDAAGYLRDCRLRLAENYKAEITYEDGTVLHCAQRGTSGESAEGEAGRPVLVREADKKERISCDPYEVSYISHKAVLKVVNAGEEKAVRSIVVTDAQKHAWHSDMEGVLAVDYTLDYRYQDGSLFIEIPLRMQDGQCMSVQLSCHDNGWEGFAEEENPYVARGSRYLMGYAVLLAPAIPIFVSGEEFDADYRPLPHLSGSLYGKDQIGRGRWLYGSWIDWEQLKQPDKKEMLEDTRRLLEIRNSYPHLIRACRMGEEKEVCVPVPFRTEADIPVPYLYLDEKKEEAVLVIANPSREEDLSVKVDLKKYLDRDAVYSVNSLFGGNVQMEECTGVLSETVWKAAKDNRKNGGLLVLYLKKRT